MSAPVIGDIHVCHRPSTVEGAVAIFTTAGWVWDIPNRGVVTGRNQYPIRHCPTCGDRLSRYWTDDDD